MSHGVGRNAYIKARYVEKDERNEKGVRAALNYGHTLGHAADWELDPEGVRRVLREIINLCVKAEENTP